MHCPITPTTRIPTKAFALLLAGLLCIPTLALALDAELLAIPVTASDSTFEEGVLVTWPQAGTDSVFYRVLRDGGLLSYLPSEASSYLDTSAAVRTEYEYCVHLYDVRTDTEIDLGCDTGSRAFLRPASVEASDGGFTDRVRVTWLDRSRIETGYEIWREEPDSTWVLAGTTQADRSTFDDTGAVPGVTYTYCVNAIRGARASESGCDQGMCSHVLAPGSVEATDGQYTDRVLITWEDRSDNETVFEIARDAAVIDSVPAGATSYSDSAGLGTWHTYCVTAIGDTAASPQVCDAGIGGDSTMVPPGNVQATYDDFDDRVIITWEDSTGAEDGFAVYRAGSLIATVFENATVYKDLEAPPGAVVSYGVVAVSDLGGSSIAASATGRRSLIVPPTDVSASDGESETYVEISWESASTTVVLFTVSRGGLPIKTTAGGNLSAQDFDIAPGVDYEYCVWGVTAMGDTSLHVCDTGRRELRPPAFVSASEDTLEDRVVVTWTDVSLAEDGYRIYRKHPHPDSTAVEVGTAPANRGMFEDGKCKSDVDYEYSVAAYDARGESETASDTGNRVLLPPTSVKATDGEFEDRVGITWQGESFAETGYRIYRKHPDPDSAAVLVGSTDEYAIGFTDLSPEFGVEFMYYVAARDAWGESQLVGDEGSTTLLPPGWVSASEVYDDGVVITWVDQSGMETGYQILRNATPLDTTGAGVTSFTDTTALYDLTYEYCVRTLSAGGSSDEDCDTGMRPSPLPAPELPSVTLTPSDGRMGFGASVSMDGDFLVVGAAGDTYPVTVAGAAFFLERDGADWVETFKCSSGVYFGRSVDISGEFALVGDASYASYTGCVHIYAYDGQAWAEDTVLTASDGQTDDYFGHSVAIDGNLAIVGAYNADGGVAGSGAAYVYKYEAGTWTEIAKLYASDGQDGALFGWSVDVDGDWVVIGARYWADGADHPGAAYIYWYNGVTWTEVDRLETSGPLTELGAAFGASVAIDGDLIVVGEPSHSDNPNKGVAYVFTNYYGETWVETAKLTPIDGMNWDYFGQSVSVDGDMVLVGAPGFTKEAAYVYALGGSTWNNLVKLTATGDAVDVDGAHCVVGSGKYGGYTGDSVTVYIQKTPPPATVVASSGDFEDRVRIEWQDDSPYRAGYEGAFRIYRDGQVIGALGPAARSYDDFAAVPGRTYEYGVAAYWEATGESDPVFVYGRRPPDGAVSGRVTSRAGAGVESVMVYLSPPPNSALLLDGVASYVEVGNPAIPGDSLTMEFWMRGTDAGRDGWVMCYAAGSDLSEALLGIGDISDLRVRVGGVETHGSGVGLDDSEWHHVAVTWRSSDGRVEIFKDGESAYDTTGISTGYSIPSGGTLIMGQNPWQGFAENYALAGQLDEVRIWDEVRSADEVRAARKTPLSGEENALAAYWPFDEGVGEYATADLTSNNAYGGLKGAIHWTQGTDSLEISTFTDLEGRYALTGIRYGVTSTLEVIPYMERRTFDPAFRNLILAPESPVANQIDFTDVSSFTLAGRVYFRNTDCPLENAEVWVDDELKGATDRNGNYRVAVDPGIRVIETRFTDHTFEPASIETLVARDVFGLDFEDTLVRRLSGWAGGGCDISFGTLDIEIWARGGCFDTTLEDAGGDFEVLLPPLEYFASVESVHVDAGSGIDIVDLERFYQDMGAREIDLTDADSELDLTYWAPLGIQIEGLPALECTEIADEDRGTVVPAVPILDQGEGVELTIRVVSDYGDSGTCLVDSGTVTIFDEVMDIADQPVTLRLNDGVVTYTTYGGYPNIFSGRRDADGNDRSYQKALTVVAEVENRAPARHTRWVMVTGDLPRTGTFVSATTEEFPLLILRDPPGDGSYSYIERGRTVTTRFSDMVCRETGGSGGFAVKAGVAFGISVGWSAFGVTWSISTEFAGWVQGASGWEWGVRATDEGAMELSLTTTERFSTSSSDLYVGPDGDVYLGLAMNLIFAKADVLGIDRSSEPCKIVKSETVRFGVDGEQPFETIYLYTQDHIENTLIPQFEDLADLEPDRADEFGAYIANWQSHLDRNDSLRTLALQSPRENRSFSAGATLEFKETKDSTGTFTTAFETFSSDESAKDFGFEAGGFGIYGFRTNLTARCSTYTVTTDTTDVLEVGYLMTDDDPGDYFSTDIASDAEYGTPVFGLRSGRSSCPYEPGTQPRDSLFMTIEPDSLQDVPPDEPAVFTLTLTNASVSKEAREYVLYPLQTSNPGGALLRANGELFHDGLSFTILPDQSQEATLTVERGPSKYYYRDLKLVLMSACDESIADTVTFSVAFDAPCSDITLYSPQPGWDFNLANAQATGDSLDLILADFEMRVSQYDSLLLVGAEYRPAETDDEPVTIGLIARENITLNPDGTPQSQHIPWDLSAVEDGRYEVRAYTQCTSGGPVNSSFATGTIDRACPTPIVAPQPADGELALGDEISVTFNEPIRCSSVNPMSITLECVNPDSGSSEVGFEVTCNGSRVAIAPDITDISSLEGKIVRATITGVRDLLANPMIARDSTSTETWEFGVRRSAFVWSEADIISQAAYRNGGSFTAELVNGTPEAIVFRLISLPDWLTPATTSGSLFSSETREIDFGIPDTLGIGTYQDTLYAQVDGAVPEVLAPLHVTVEVACQAPAWALDPARFEHSMNIVAELQIGGVASQDTSDMVAAYVGNQVRGVAGPARHADPAYDYLVYLTVYSNRTGGETIRFRVWDEDSCRLYAGTDKVFTFEADGHIGSPENPEMLAATDSLPGTAQVVDLSEGWTWFSLNLLDADMSVNGVLADLNVSTADLIKSQAEFSQFDPDLGWVGSLTDLDNASSYAISLADMGTLIHDGAPVDPDTIPMPGSAGWHWIGYLPQTAQDVGDALSGLAPSQDDIIKSQFEFAQVNVNGDWLGSLQTLEPGRGYRLWLGAACPTWYYGSDSSGVPHVTADESGGGDENHWSVNTCSYEHSMCVVGELELDGAPVSSGDYLVGAFVDEEIRGVAPLRYVPQLQSHLAFLMIHSNVSQGEPVTFQTYAESERKEMTLRETLTFVADEPIGSLDSPFIFTGTAGDTTGLPAAFSLAQNHPNPVTMGAMGIIQYALPTAAHVVIRVYDVRGREALTLVDRDQPAGWHHVELDPVDFGSGIYFYRMTAGGFVKQRKMTVLR
jgi:fibronectin type 3 domain-containing protein